MCKVAPTCLSSFSMFPVLTSPPFVLSLCQLLPCLLLSNLPSHLHPLYTSTSDLSSPLLYCYDYDYDCYSCFNRKTSPHVPPSFLLVQRIHVPTLSINKTVLCNIAVNDVILKTNMKMCWPAMLLFWLASVPLLWCTSSPRHTLQRGAHAGR